MTDLPRLLLCCFDVIPAPTAISRRMTEYLKGLSERYQVVVLTVKTPDHTHIERYQGARLLRVPVGSGDLAARVQAFDRAVRRQLDSEEYVMVHFFDPFGGYAVCERRSEFGYKLVYDACSLPSVDLPFLVSEAEANRRFLAKVRRQELFCLMNADVVIVANELTRDFVAGLGVPRAQVQVLPAPVDLGPYDPALMGVPDGTPMKLLHLGNQSDAQDLSTLLAAMQLALQTVDVRLTILGPKDEEHQARLEEEMATLKLSGKVDFQPQVAHDDLHKVLAAADVGLLTLSDVERNSRVGSPLSRLGEYLAAGRPVIAADVAAARALLPDDGVVLYRPQDKASLADAIVTLATEPNRRVKLGAAARAASLDRDAAKVRADLVAIYVTLSGTGVRAVGDADATNPDEVTQLGRSLDAEDTQKKKVLQARDEQPSGTGKVTTDPAIVVEATSPEANAGLDRPSVMGVPLHDDEPPVVVGHEFQEVAAEFAQVSTEPNARRSTEPPVVMGMPLSESPRSNPEAPTPGDLAAELGEIAASAPGIEAPTAAIPDEPRHLDDAPTTGSHLSLVRTPETDDPSGTTGEYVAEASEYVPPQVPSLDSARDERAVEREYEPPQVELAEPNVSEREYVPPQISEPMPTAPTPETLSGREYVSPQVSAPVPTAPTPERDFGLPQVSELSPERESVPQFSSAKPDEPMPTVPTRPPEPESEPAKAPAPRPAPTPPRVVAELEMPPPISSSPSALIIPPPATTSSAAPFASSPSRAPFSSSSSGLHTPPPLPRTIPREPGGVPLLAVPPMPARSSSGVFAVAPQTAQPVLPQRSSPSGIYATVPTTPAPAMSEPKSSKAPTGLFPEPPSVPEEIDESEIQSVDGEGDGPREVGADEIEDLSEPPADEAPQMASEESVTTVDTDASPPPSAIDPWLAQLVHGYCPPESGLFLRHTPPTTMPGRDT